MRRSLISRSNQSPNRRVTRLDNITFIPASLLPFKDEYQAIANTLPPGEMLFVVTPHKSPMLQNTRRVAASMRAQGHAVAVMTADRFI